MNPPPSVETTDQSEQAKMLLRARDLRGSAMLQALGEAGLPYKNLARVIETERGADTPQDEEACTREELEEAWRTNPAWRAMCCRLSTLFVNELTEMGFSIRPPKDKELVAHYDRIRTTPARPAYDVA